EIDSLVFISTTLFALGPYSEIIPLSSSLYKEMDDLYAIQDLGTPSTARPWSKGEAQLILSRVQGENLKGSAKSLYDSVSKMTQTGLRWQFGDGFGFEFRANIDGEIYTHINDIDFTTDKDWLYGYEERNPFLKGHFAFGVKDFFYAFVDYQYGYGRTNAKDTTTDLATLTNNLGVGSLVPAGLSLSKTTYATSHYLYTTKFLFNLPVSFDADFEMPKRSILSFGGLNWNFSLSRDRISWGASHIGNLIIDDHVDFQNFARLSAYTDKFKFDIVYIFLNTDPTSGENADDWANTTEKFERIFMTHRVEFRFSKWATLSLSENGMYQAWNGHQFFYMNPIYIFHSLNDRCMFNSIISAELDVMPFTGLHLYGQFALDQARAVNEQADQSNAWGALGGAEYTHCLRKGIVSSSLEFAYTTPVLYRRDGVDFLMLFKDYAIGKSHVVSFDYIGFPYGGDAEVLRWDVDYRIPQVFQLRFAIEGMLHGEMNLFMSHATSGDNTDRPNYAGITPSGDNITQSLKASLYGKYEIPNFVSWIKMSTWGEIDWIGTRVYTRSTKAYSEEASDVQLSMGVGLEF
ncbi:MAG: hypothetical protein WC159_03375, partial [Sphaerochaetaceae bacterium]